MRRSLVLVLFCTAACNVMPPSVDSIHDVRSLTIQTRSVRARGLPDEDVESLSRLRLLERLDFGGGRLAGDAELTDAGLLKLPGLGLDRLTDLSLGYNPNITEVGLSALEFMPSLTNLFLMGCENVSDAALPMIVAAPGVTYLDLRGCPKVTDEGLLVLAQRQNWQSIVLDGCSSVTDFGVMELRYQIPGARISKDDASWAFQMHSDHSADSNGR